MRYLIIGVMFVFSGPVFAKDVFPMDVPAHNSLECPNVVGQFTSHENAEDVYSVVTARTEADSVLFVFKNNVFVQGSKKKAVSPIVIVADGQKKPQWFFSPEAGWEQSKSYAIIACANKKVYKYSFSENGEVTVKNSFSLDAEGNFVRSMSYRNENGEEVLTSSVDAKFVE